MAAPIEQHERNLDFVNAELAIALAFYFVQIHTIPGNVGFEPRFYRASKVWDWENPCYTAHPDFEKKSAEHSRLYRARYKREFTVPFILTVFSAFTLVK